MKINLDTLRIEAQYEISSIPLSPLLEGTSTILKFILAAAFALALIGLGIYPLLKNRQHSQSAAQPTNRNSIKEIARRGKAEGREAVHIRGPISEFPGEDMDIDEALRDYTVVVAQPLTSKSYLIGDDGIHTWYRFRIIDTISRKDAALCYTCPPVPEAPRDLPSLSADEFFLPVGGGTVIQDGVAVTMDNPNFPPFQNSTRYLVILRLTPSGVALLGAGPTGIFQTSDNELLEPYRSSKAPPFRMDVYNLLNHTNFGEFNGVITSPLFGRAPLMRKIPPALSSGEEAHESRQAP